MYRLDRHHNFQLNLIRFYYTRTQTLAVLIFGRHVSQIYQERASLVNSLPSGMSSLCTHAWDVSAFLPVGIAQIVTAFVTDGHLEANQICVLKPNLKSITRSPMLREGPVVKPKSPWDGVTTECPGTVLLCIFGVDGSLMGRWWVVDGWKVGSSWGRRNFWWRNPRTNTCR